MRRWRHIAAVIGGAAFALSCATGVTSPYLRPEEGVLYRYGAFCGPGHPPVLQDAALGREQRLAALAAIEPLDAVDRACQFHDVCYELFAEGDGRGRCDDAFVSMLAWTNTHLAGERAVRGRCANLSSEISTGMILGRSSTIDRALTGVSTALFAPVDGALNAGQGFPDESGECRLNGETVTLNESPWDYGGRLWAKDPLYLTLYCYFSRRAARSAQCSYATTLDEIYWVSATMALENDELTAAGERIRAHLAATPAPAVAPGDQDR